MKFQHLETDGDTLCAKSVGRLAPDPEDQLRDQLVEMYGPEVFARQMTLDLGDSDFISSSGIGWLLRMHKRFEQHGGRLTIRRVSKEIDQTLRLMRLQTVLHIA